MVVKKKKETAEEKPIAPPVKQVVEVVTEDSMTEDSITVEVEAPKPSPVDEAPASPVAVAPSLQEQQKETVAELFKHPESMVMPEITVHKESGSKKKFIWIIIGFVLLVLVGGGAFLVKGNSSLPFLSVAPTPTPIPTPTPMPIPQRKDITIEILNGGGVPGAASKMKTLLEEKGYVIGNVTNAEEYTFDKTEIHVKAGKEAYQKLLIEDLQDTYVLASETGTLSDSVSYDARVIVGKK